MAFIANPFIEENWNEIFRTSASTDFFSRQYWIASIRFEGFGAFNSRAGLKRMLIYNCVSRVFSLTLYSASLKWQLQKFIPANLEQICIDVVEMRNSVKITFSSFARENFPLELQISLFMAAASGEREFFCKYVYRSAAAVGRRASGLGKVDRASIMQYLRFALL